jgi:P4 family phage/plasmid primase-like protien
MQNTRKALLDAALLYASKGWHVFPVLPRTKKPAVKWKEAATTSIEAIESTWRTKPYNVGIATGRVSGIVVLDIDVPKLDDESRAFAEQVRAKCPTFTVRTGTGGFHYYFAAPVTPLTNLAGCLAGIDFRGDGGLVVAAPSQHENGNFYEVIQDGECMELPLWLYEILWPRKEEVPGKGTAVTAPGQKGKLSRATLDFMVNGAEHAHDSTWNHRLWRAGRDYKEQGYTQDEFIEKAEKITGHLDRNDLTTIVESAFGNDAKYGPRGIDEEESQNATILSRAFLQDSGLEHSLKYWQRGYYQWEQTHYREVTKEDLRFQIVRWLQDFPGLTRAINSRLTDDILLNIIGRVGLSSKIAPPAWLQGGLPTNLISMANGLLEPGTRKVVAHSHDFFNFTCLPYSYDPSAACPTWLKFLEEIQPDPDVRAVLQEWFGYNLTLDTSHAMFALFEGEGANGKTVCCVVLRELLGAKNVTHVSLEGFNAERTFPLAATTGKLANIVEEMNEVDKAQEGLLKQFVSGGAITVERKNQDPFTLIPTAKLTFATNVLPRLADRSMGIWRRMIMIPFRFQLLDNARQDKRLVRGDFWRPELPGIFNWALEGLARLNNRNFFTEPKVCKDAVNAYRLEMNPAQQFLMDHYEPSKDGKAEKRRKVLYDEYESWMKDQGGMPMGSANFTREVKRAFPTVTLSDNALRQSDGTRDRVWYGLVARAGDLPTGKPGKLDKLDKPVKT